MRNRSLRQSFLGEQSDDILAGAHVAIVGLGGGGSHVAQQLAHVGIGAFTIIDPDYAEVSNLNRLIGATQQDVDEARPKVEISKRLIEGILPAARVFTHKARWQDVAEYLRNVDVIVGCVDSFSDREQLENSARRFLIPYVDIGMDVTEAAGGFAISGQAALSLPGMPCLRCMRVIREDDLARERYGVAGGKPQVVWPNGMLASIAVGFVVQLLTPWNVPIGAQLLFFEGNRQEVRRHTWVDEHRTNPCPHYRVERQAVGDPFWTLPSPTSP
jgi:hypothetical protein